LFNEKSYTIFFYHIIYATFQHKKCTLVICNSNNNLLPYNHGQKPFLARYEKIQCDIIIHLYVDVLYILILLSFINSIMVDTLL